MPRKKKERSDEFNPDWVTPPGGTIKEAIAARGMTYTEFGNRMALRPEVVDKLLEGELELNLDIAQRLCVVLGVYNVNFWLTREKHYREGLARGLKKV